jgi:hypothetical protein
MIGEPMRNLPEVAVISAIALTGVGAWTLPAAAATLALDFNPPTSYTSNDIGDALNGVPTNGLGWEFTVTSTVTVTNLGSFDNGAVANITQGQGDQTLLYSGAPPTVGSPGTALATASVGGSSGGTQVPSAWAFNPLTTPSNATSVTLSPGTYYILTLFSINSNPIAESPTTNKGSVDQLITTAAGITWDAEVVCNPSCTTTVPGDGGAGYFAANFEIAVTPLPATLPLFAGGLGLVGYLAKRRKQSAKQALAAA